MPMGAVIFADFWIIPKLGLSRNFAESTGPAVGWIPAGAAWAASLGVAFALPVEIFFKGLPGWFVAVTTYIVVRFAVNPLVVRRTVPAASSATEA
jgi:hypothetical protein